MTNRLPALALALGLWGCSSSTEPPRPGGSASPAAASASPAVEATPSPVAPQGAPPSEAPVARTVSIPAGTVLALTLETSIGSDTSRVEDPIRARLRKPVVVGGVVAAPAGAEVVGAVTEVKDSGRVKGRGEIGFRFHTLIVDGEETGIRTEPVTRVARATKGDDAKKIAVGAGAGAVVGAIVGGGKGAAVGAGVGGGAGTGVVLATKGEPVRLGVGAAVDVKLREAVAVAPPGAD
jgi:hypothetical protein